MNSEERYVDVDGLPTRYLRAGTAGPPLVLLHGVGDNALDWQWVMPTLARTRRVYALDLPGSGGSINPDIDYSPAFFTQFLSAFLDALEIERTAVVGNSLGGLVSLRLALSEPSRVSALGLVASAGLGWVGHLRPPFAGPACLWQVSGRLGQDASRGGSEGPGEVNTPLRASSACAPEMA